MGYCVSDENMKPFVIVAIGGIIEYFILLAISTVQIQRQIDEDKELERALTVNIIIIMFIPSPNIMRR